MKLGVQLVLYLKPLQLDLLLMSMCCKHVPSLLVSHKEASVKHMKVITRLHPKKSQHHIHNCLNLSSCCGSKWCTSTYTFTFNNNIRDVLQRVRHLLHSWTFFSWFIANSPENVDITCQAFPLILPVLPSTMMGLQPPLGQYLQRVDIGGQQILYYQWSPQTLRCILLVFPHCNRAFKHDFHKLNIQQTFIFKGWCLGTCLHM